jgi:hypothetical protein
MCVGPPGRGGLQMENIHSRTAQDRLGAELQRIDGLSVKQLKQHWCCL